ncbi:MAG: hypothetical protein F9K40_10770 [Kofleriaceae bacterium]|nr:MAG: hypothetical protein F9K40_10770 [Kofleriaceae bacterium]MBZ0236506.1 hypothetical protein [Kofleriaceae bacterium]
MVKLLLGLLKGVVLGAAIGYGAYAAGLDGGFLWPVYGFVGALVGLIAGTPLWKLITDKNATSWVSVLKAIFGFGVGCGLYALVGKVWGGFELTLDFLEARPRLVQHWQPVFGAAVGGFLGAFFEIDDAIGGDDGGTRGRGAGSAPAAKGSRPARSE